MRWLKRWSFMIILAITGIVYCGANRDLLEVTHWENLIPVGERKPEEDWMLLREGSSPESMPEELTLGKAVSGERRTGETDQALTELPEAEDQEPFGPPLLDSEQQTPVTSGEGDGEGAMPEPEPEPEIVMGRVEEDYFADALFLGDSRTVGLGQYGSLRDIATFYASTGMTIYKIINAEIVEVPDQQEKITVEEALQHQSFGKIYIMMGINEVGSGTTESFTKAYGEVIARLQELQPDAIIYIEGILKVTKARSDKGDYINNEAIGVRNEALSQLADGEKIFYLDVNQAVCDEDGGLVKDYTSDGVHLKAKYITLWEEYLKDNAVLIDGGPEEAEEQLPSE